MATVLSFLSGRQITDANGNPEEGAVLYHYQAGTTNDLTVYSNQAGTIPRTQPVDTDAGGFVPLIYIGDTSDWKVVIKTAEGAILHTYDNLPKAVAEQSAVGFAPPLLPWVQVNSAASPVALTAANAGNAYEANTTSGSIEFDLPSAASVGTGKGFWFKKTASANSMIIDPNGSETIDDSSDSLIITRQYQVIFIVSNGAEWYVATQSLDNIPQPNGYLTLVSGTPVIVSDQASATSVFYTPDKGNLVPLYNGTNFTLLAFSELTLALVSAHLASTIYDIFVWSEAGVLTIGTGPAWSVSTAGAGARGSGVGTTELTRVQGLFVNTVQIAARNGSTTYTVAANRATYVGSIFIDSVAGQVTCHRSFGQSRKWGLWNPYNQRGIILSVGDSTASWTYATATIRASNNNANNRATIFSGLADGLFNIEANQYIATPPSASARIGIGLNSTTAFSGFVGRRVVGGVAGSGVNGTHTARLVPAPIPAIGIHNIQFLEISDGGTTTFSGLSDGMSLFACWMG